MTLAPGTIDWLRAVADDPSTMSSPRAAASLADRDDVRRTVGGDGEAFARIVRRHQPTLAARMRRFTRDAGEVEQLVHDAFVEAYLSLPRFRGDAPLEHWLQRIATRVGYRYWTKNKRRPATMIDETVPAPRLDDAVEAGDEKARLWAAVEQLSPRDRLAITLLYVEGHDVAEAARLAGWSRTMMKVQAFRARGKLKKLLGEPA